MYRDEHNIAEDVARAVRLADAQVDLDNDDDGDVASVRRARLGVAGWLDVLARNPRLSNRYRVRYAQLLARNERRLTELSVQELAKLAVSHPSKALRLMISTRDQSVTGSEARSWQLLREGSVGRGLDGLDLDAYIASSPELEQTSVPLHPDRRAHLMGSTTVAVAWSKWSLADREANAARMSEIAAHASRRSPLVFEVWEDYTVYGSDADHVWTFAPNFGQTLEDRLRDGHDERRDDVVRALCELRSAMHAAGTLWQGFAPRNMFVHDGRIVLIDFEEVVAVDEDPARAYECELWHRVFFADCLRQDEATKLFGSEDIPTAGFVEERRPSDDFERALLGRETVTLAERGALLRQSARLEGRHRRRDGGTLFGHELGHFWGDFVSVETEVQIFAALADGAGEATVTACLEVFEAAMEADIISMMSARAHGRRDEVSTSRTDALTRSLTDCGASALATARETIGDWAEHFANDVVALVDRFLFDLDGGDVDVDGLIGAASRDFDQATIDRSTRMGLSFLSGRESFLKHEQPADLARLVAEDLPLTGSGIDQVLAEVQGRVVEHSISQAHPDYLAFPDSANSLAALSGSILAKFLNQNLIAVERSAPVATFVEVQVISWLRTLVGYDTKPLEQMLGVKDVGGMWTTGGHLSNHVAMLTALGATFPEVRQRGLRGLNASPTVVMAGPIAHYSHSDAAFHLGLGWDGVDQVGANSDFTTDVSAVERALAEPRRGTKPFMVVGVAGNCRTTGLDDLAAIGEMCRRYGVWFHVDACHGGSLLFSERLKDRHLRGIEAADSVSLDPHKGLFTPYPSSYVVFRDPRVLTQFSRHEQAVLADDSWDLGLITPFLGSRGFESLATWMMIKNLGVRQLGALVERRQRLARYLQRRMGETGYFVNLNDVDFYRVATVLCPPKVQDAIRDMSAEDRPHAIETVSRFTSRLNTTLYESGTVCFDEHTLADIGDRVGAGADAKYTIMAACPGNPLTTREDLDRAVEAAAEVAVSLEEEMMHAITRTATKRPHINPLGGPAGWSLP